MAITKPTSGSSNVVYLDDYRPIKPMKNVFDTTMHICQRQMDILCEKAYALERRSEVSLRVAESVLDQDTRSYIQNVAQLELLSFGSYLEEQEPGFQSIGYTFMKDLQSCIIAPNDEHQLRAILTDIAVFKAMVEKVSKNN